MEIDHEKINWELLREQKFGLLDAIDVLEGEQASPEDNRFTEIIGHLEGILNFLDYIQDTAVDEGWVPEERVFRLTKE